MSTDRQGYAMATPDEAARELRAIARLADEQGDALDRAFRLFGDGALLGPRAAALHAGLVDRRAEVGQAFTRAFQQVERLATARGDPVRVPAPHPRRPPAPLREPPGGYVGGDPDLIQAVDTELAEVSESWRRAGQGLATALFRLGLDATPGQDIARAAAWLSGQRPDLRRRRAELLKTPPQTAWDAVTGAVGGAVSRVGSFWAEAVSHAVPGAGRLPRQYAERVAVPLAQGAAEAVIGAARFGWEHSLIGAVTDPSAITGRLQAARETGEFAAEHPVEFGESVIGWETLTEDPARWFGRLIPEALLGGGGAATRAGRVAGALTPARPRLPDGSPIPPPRTAADGPPQATIPMRSRHEGEERNGVRYLDPAALERRRLVVHDGKLYDVNGKPFDTTDASAHFSGQGRAIFVMDRYGNIYANKSHEVGRFHHSSFLRGGEVAAAGDLEVKNGVLTAISRHSGHYRPGPEALQRALDRLRSAGVDVEAVRKETYAHG